MKSSLTNIDFLILNNSLEMKKKTVAGLFDNIYIKKTVLHKLQKCDYYGTNDVATKLNKMSDKLRIDCLMCTKYGWFFFKHTEKFIYKFLIQHEQNNVNKTLCRMLHGKST